MHLNVNVYTKYEYSHRTGADLRQWDRQTRAASPLEPCRSETPVRCVTSDTNVKFYRSKHVILPSKNNSNLVKQPIDSVLDNS